MSLLSLIPAPYRWGGILIISGLVMTSILYYGKTRFDAGEESVRNELREASDQAASEARLISLDRRKIAEKTDAETLTKINLSRSRSFAINSDANLLRDTLKVNSQPTTGPNPSQCDFERAYSNKLADLLEESSRLLEEGAGITGEAVPLIEGFQAREKAK